jgi:hypothetical protein
MIDYFAEEYVRDLISMSKKHIPQGEEFVEEFDEDFDDTVLELGKEITEFATKLLEERLGAEFPYVDENY